MNKRISRIISLVIVVLMASATSLSRAQEFKGKIAKSYKESEEWWPPEVRPPEGETDLKLNFIKTQEFGGKGELYVNGNKVDEADMPQMHISTYSPAETFDVGRDTGAQVSRIYAGDPFPFNGDPDRVTITLTD